MKDKGKNEYILAHEQHHFDISYISTLMFIKKLQKTKFTDENYSSDLQSIYNKAIEDMEELQNKYDTETKNGILIDEQLASLISE